MSRPTRPVYPVQAFAPNDNYPAGGNTWNGNPTKVAPPGASSVGISPGQGNAAQYHNWIHYTRGVEAQNAQSALQALYDWTIDRLGYVDVRNWFPYQAAVTGCSHVRYSKEIGKHYACGFDGSGFAVFARSGDPQSWGTTNELGSSFGTFDGSFDVATDGSLVIPGSGSTYGAEVYECTPAGVWTIRAAVFANTRQAPDVVFEPVSGNWIAVGGRIGSLLLDVSTSTNRVAWTARTGPASIPTTLDCPQARLAKDRLGKVVAQLFPANDLATNSISFSCSSDGGVTWSAVNTHALPYSPSASNGFVCKPVWNGSLWVAVTSCHASGAITERTDVFTSTDGITWSAATTLTSVSIQNIASSIDGILVGVCRDQSLVYSSDNGGTWHPAGLFARNGASATLRIFAANGGFVITDATNSKIRHSVVFGSGSGSGAALT